MRIDGRNISGYIPGGEDRPQWIFDGDGWDTEETEPIIRMISAYVREYREKWEFDMVNGFRFTYWDDNSPVRIYHMQRRNWVYVQQAHGLPDLLQKLAEAIKRL